MNGIFIDGVCTRASCGTFEQTDSSFTLDLTGSYDINEDLRLFARAENLTDEQDIMGRQPYGARPNKSKTLSVGAQFRF